MHASPIGWQLVLALIAVTGICCLQCLAVAPATQQAVHSIRESSSSSSGDPPGRSCSVTQPKEDCGYLGIQQAECESKHCCWQPVDDGSNTPWCFFPQAPQGPTYTVTQRSDTDDHTTELLLQLSQPVLPQYGPDFQQLAVTVEAQTPHRVHVKIRPDGDTARWEVPEHLVPRPGSIAFDPASALYSVQLPSEGDKFGFAVKHKDMQEVKHHKQQQQGKLGDDEASVFDTSGTGLVFKQQYMEITTRIAAATSVYGLGETTQRSGHLKLPRNGRIITLWNYDIGCYNTDINLYGSHPFYLQVHSDGVASGVFLLNSNGMDIELQEESITYRVIGGILDFYFLLGPRPEDVIQQYQEVIGHPAMPPLWALGFHQCRWGYKTLSDVKQVVEGYKEANIPLEVMWADIDYMDRYRDFTFDPQRFNQQELRAFVDSLHASGQKWVPITDCGIPHAPDDPAYVSGMKADVFIKDVTGTPYLGQVWPGATHYPDFLSVNKTWPWWKEQLQHMWEKVPYDGMWIDMNEASNFCDGEICKLPAAHADDTADGSNSALGQSHAAGDVHAESGNSVRRTWNQLQLVANWVWSIISSQAPQPHSSPDHPSSSDSADEVATEASSANCALQCSPPAATDTLSNPPYAINNLQNHVHLGSKALPVTARHLGGELEYDAHNLYGLSEAAATRTALEQITRKRSFVLSRSTFPGAGVHAAHWTGDNAATWEDLLWSVSGLLNSNMWGIPLAGADICGFQGDTNEELCARWIQAGSFYTFARNHNSINGKPQELYLWSSVAEAGRKALAMRYSLLPYMYTSFYKAHVDGGTVARPLFFAFPADEQARDTYKQWMLGDSILISPVLTPSTTQLTAYFPEGSWYNLWNQNYSHIRGPTPATYDVPLTDTAVHVRGGSIVAMQEPGNTTEQVRKSGVKLVVALDQHQAGPAETSSSSSSSSSVQGYLDPDGASRPGVELGCGMLYLDDGDSLEVPPADESDSLLVLFSSMSLQSGQQGWVISTPADQFQPDSCRPDSRPRPGDGDQDKPDKCADSDTSLGAASDGHLLRMQQQHCIKQGAWSKGIGSRRPTYSADSVTIDAIRQAAAGRQSIGRTAQADRESKWPALTEITVLGLSSPVAPSTTTAVEGEGIGSRKAVGEAYVSTVGYSVSVNGQQVAGDQVVYDADRLVLSVTGLQVVLTDEIKLEWLVSAAA